MSDAGYRHTVAVNAGEYLILRVNEEPTSASNFSAESMREFCGFMSEADIRFESIDLDYY